MNTLQALFNKNMMQSLILEIADLESEMLNPRSKPAKNAQRVKAIKAKKEAIKQIEELMK